LPIGGTFVLDPLTSVLFTVLIVVISINAINFVDGLDGLAAGIVLVAAGAFFGYAYLLSVESGLDRATLATLVSVLLVGMTVGFLPHNYTPARIFMGDTGSMAVAGRGNHHALRAGRSERSDHRSPAAHPAAHRATRGRDGDTAGGPSLGRHPEPAETPSRRTSSTFTTVS